MTLLQKLSLAATIGSTTFSFAASIPNKTILPDNVVRCEPSAGCVNQTLYGRNYKVIATPRFTVMVSVSHEGIYTRADVSITNNTDMPLSVTPEDFRVEVVTPKPKVLLYVPPANLDPPRQPHHRPLPPPLLRCAAARSLPHPPRLAPSASVRHPPPTSEATRAGAKSCPAGSRREGCRRAASMRQPRFRPTKSPAAGSTSSATRKLTSSTSSCPSPALSSSSPTQ